MNWDDLRYFAAFVDQGSLLGAARTLGVEHATVARRLESLEQSLSLRLVDRRGRRLVLTHDGDRIAAIARKMDSEADAIARLAGGTGHAVAGEVTLSVPPAFGSAVVAPRLAELNEQHPQLTVRLQAESRQASLSRREADIAIRLIRPTEGDLTIVKVADVRFRPYASRDYLDRIPTELWQFIGSARDMAASPQQQALDTIRSGRRMAFWSDDVLTQLALCRGGGGIAMLPDFLKPEDGGLCDVCPERPPLIREAWLVVHDDLRRSAPVRAVVEHLKRTLAAPSADSS